MPGKMQQFGLESFPLFMELLRYGWRIADDEIFLNRLTGINYFYYYYWSVVLSEREGFENTVWFIILNCTRISFF